MIAKGLPSIEVVVCTYNNAAMLDDVPGLSHKLLAALATQVRSLDAQVYG